MKFLAKLTFKILGWKQIGNIPPHIKKCVIIGAPHTSNWDLFYGRLGLYLAGVKLKFLIKKELFFFPLGTLLKALGGIPVDRSKKSNMVEYVVSLFDKYMEFKMAIAPEGTRKFAKEWKKGFYYVAQNALVPIILGYLDYKKKIAGIGPVFNPTGDVDKDIEEIKNFYRTTTPKYPKQGVKSA